MRNEFKGIPCPKCGKKGLKFDGKLQCAYCNVASKDYPYYWSSRGTGMRVWQR